MAHALYVKAGIAACEEDSIRAVRELTLAVEEYDRSQMPLRAQILQYRLGEIQSDDASREPGQGRVMDQGTGNRLPRPLGRDVCPGVLENLDRVDRDELLIRFIAKTGFNDNHILQIIIRFP